jgi:hypothetical protein
MKIERWNWKRVTGRVYGLEEPFHWRRERVVLIEPDPFGSSFIDRDRDQLFGTILACQEFTNCSHHTFFLNTQHPGRIRAYLARPSVDLLKNWAKASLGRCQDGDISVFDLVYSMCANRWSDAGIGLEEHVPWSHPENCYPLRNLWFGGSVLQDLPMIRKYSDASP